MKDIEIKIDQIYSCFCEVDPNMPPTAVLDQLKYLEDHLLQVLIYQFDKLDKDFIAKKEKIHKKIKTK